MEEKFKKFPYRSQDGLEGDAEVLVKYFNPAGAGTWLITEAEEQKDGDWLLYGYFHILEWEWGSVMLSELESIKGPFGLGIERDLYTGNQKYIKDFPETDYYEKANEESMTNDRVETEERCYPNAKPEISIGDYSVANINWFKEHEGLDAFQCDILFCGQKIGFFSEDYMNGPDNYTFIDDFDKELEKLRTTAKQFFDKYSKDPDLYKTEDFFIRFLKSLKEASNDSNIVSKISINTSYPYDYEILKNDNQTVPTIKENEDSNNIVIPIIPFSINIDVSDEKDDEYEFI